MDSRTNRPRAAEAFDIDVGRGSKFGTPRLKYSSLLITIDRLSSNEPSIGTPVRSRPTGPTTPSRGVSRYLTVNIIKLNNFY